VGETLDAARIRRELNAATQQLLKVEKGVGGSLRKFSGKREARSYWEERRDRRGETLAT